MTKPNRRETKSQNGKFRDILNENWDKAKINFKISSESNFCNLFNRIKYMDRSFACHQLDPCLFCISANFSFSFSHPLFLGEGRRQWWYFSDINSPPITTVRRRGKGGLPPGFWNLTFFKSNFYQKRLFSLFRVVKMKILPLLVRLQKCFWLPWKIHYWPHPGKNPSDIHASYVIYGVWVTWFKRSLKYSLHLASISPLLIKASFWSWTDLTIIDLLTQRRRVACYNTSCLACQ